MSPSPLRDCRAGHSGVARPRRPAVPRRVSAIRFRSLTRLMPACPAVLAQGAALARCKDLPAVKSQTPFRVPPDQVRGPTRREDAVAFDGLPRSSFPLASPVSPTGKGCSSLLQPKTKGNRRPS